MKRRSEKHLEPLCRDALNVSLSDAASLRIQAALDHELDTIRNAPPKAIMTLTEVADYLRISPEALEAYLGDIPCFELGGNLLFRKEAVDAWIQMREMNYAGEVVEFDSRKRMRFIVA
jgi:hypothetical protein